MKVRPFTTTGPVDLGFGEQTLFYKDGVTGRIFPSGAVVESRIDTIVWCEIDFGEIIVFTK